ncbi:UDP-N-acetylmuramoyl-L-alanine--D-glutamate ligase [Candidatus Falkowbacteria bacterium HGW-Falkowbacteria-2]|uniref:UDP-N-acetylmuramoylalanine--D-glutamate ligase n=1 Tax=Candidatus Falkowbacteria bacterium HGW-Falkowbacteria-2 TaxID=2013769 RepID=A0A2N2DXJ6_9BACT|nr:MAG: UDP-N-acetylmuramoyl-L-alanine--D-glutamate ligase [Candidatus Falkowbacteria bacterium HGW-Falkowbacteria-2]
MMMIESQNIALLGLGKENLALLGWLFKNGYRGKATICDRRNQSILKDILNQNKLTRLTTIEWRTEKQFNKNLADFEILFRSPGWPLACPGVQEALAANVLVSSAMEFFFAICPSKNTIGVTGSKGKGTTATLISTILKKSGKKVWLGGNIGIAPFSFFDKIKKEDWVVMELSSFQLEDIVTGPRYAVITNLFHEHLSPADPLNPNYHHSFKDYWQAKLRIACHPDSKLLVINEKLKAKLEKESILSKVIYFRDKQMQSKLRGSYNDENIGAAYALCSYLKVPASTIQSAIKNFGNLEHRLEFVTEKKRVKYFDNSFATTPESTALDLLSFSEPIIQIAGGADKGADFKPLAKVIAKKTKCLILLPGQATRRLATEVRKAGLNKDKIFEAASMAEAVAIAQRKSEPGDIVLLSTACASFGIFKNYKDRGDQFKLYAKK